MNIPTSRKQIYNFKSQTTLALYDIHCPYHDETILKETIKFSKSKYKIDTIYLGGDTIDFYPISSFDKIPTKTRLQEELNETKKLLKYLRKEFPKQKFIYHQGNHEFRLDRWMMKHPDIYGLDNMKLESLLGLNELKIKLLDVKQFSCLNNDTYLLHGDEVTRKKLEKPTHDCLYGHFHKTKNVISDVSFTGESYTSYGVGSLCRLDPDYLPYNDWNNGFAVITETEIHNYRFYNNNIVR
jgi:predicted phosphodiesterase